MPRENHPNVPSPPLSLEGKLGSQTQYYRFNDQTFAGMGLPEARSLQLVDSATPLTIDANSLDPHAKSYFDSKGSRLHAVKTCGDGACAIHAAFGVPSAACELFRDGARNMAAALLGPDPEALLSDGVDPIYVNDIQDSLWCEYVQPILDSNTDETTHEGEIYGRNCKT